MILSADRQMAISLIDGACAAGARQARACAVLEIDVRTLRRWRQQQRQEQRLIDRRHEAAADRVPANKLSPEERAQILEGSPQEVSEELFGLLKDKGVI